MSENQKHEHDWQVISTAHGKHVSLCMGKEDSCGAKRTLLRSGEETIEEKKRDE